MSRNVLSYTITVLGGDYRNYLLYQDFVQKGFSVSGIALFNPNTSTCLQAESSDTGEPLLASDIWITGIPFTKDHTHIYTENTNYLITLDYFLLHLKKHPPKLLIGGHFPEDVIAFCRENQIPCRDILKENSLAIANAVPTAEGAIYYAMQYSPYVLHNMPCLVLGFGKCGRALAHKLQGLCAKITICARKEADLILAASYGYQTCNFQELPTQLKNTQFVFNTIPSLVLNQDRLQLLPKDCTIIDIASKPGGCDFISAKKLGLSAHLCLGLPGKLSPKTASEIISKQVIVLLSNQANQQTE